MKTLCLAGWAIVAALQGQAQGRHVAPEAAARRLTERQDRLLTLNGAQRKQLLEVNRRYFDARDSLNVHPDPDNTARMEAWHQLNQHRDNQYRRLLSADQFKTWNDWLLHHRKKLQEKVKPLRERAGRDNVRDSVRDSTG